MLKDKYMCFEIAKIHNILYRQLDQWLFLLGILQDQGTGMPGFCETVSEWDLGFAKAFTKMKLYFKFGFKNLR